MGKAKLLWRKRAKRAPRAKRSSFAGATRLDCRPRHHSSSRWRRASPTFESIGTEAATLLEQTRQLYAAGEATLTELLEAFRATEEASLAVIDLAEELVLVRLERMAAAGTQLDPALDKACSDPDRSKP